jgi:hypothetical protein
MSNPKFTPMTDEQREVVKQERIAAQEYAKEHLKTEYMDQNYWAETASKYGLRLPGWWIPSSEVKYIRRACKKVGVEVSDFIDSTGFSNLNQLAANNPRWNAVSMVGLVLEFKENQNV